MLFMNKQRLILDGSNGWWNGWCLSVDVEGQCFGWTTWLMLMSWLTLWKWVVVLKWPLLFTLNSKRSNFILKKMLVDIKEKVIFMYRNIPTYTASGKFLWWSGWCAELQYHHHHHHVVPLAWISLARSRHFLPIVHCLWQDFRATSCILT